MIVVKMSEERTMRLFDPSSHGIRARESNQKVEFDRQEKLAPLAGKLAIEQSEQLDIDLYPKSEAPKA